LNFASLLGDIEGKMMSTARAIINTAMRDPVIIEFRDIISDHFLTVYTFLVLKIGERSDPFPEDEQSSHNNSG